MKSIFAERLKFARKQYGLTQHDLALDVGVSESTISGYESGRNEADIQVLKIIAIRLNTSVNWLVGFDNPINLDELITIESKKSIPLVTNINLINSALYGNKIDDISGINNINEIDFAIVVNDDSLSPLLKSKDLAYIIRNKPKNNKLVCVIHNNKTFIRKYIIKSNKKYLQALNNDYEDIELTNQHLIIGTVHSGYIKFD